MRAAGSSDSLGRRHDHLLLRSSRQLPPSKLEALVTVFNLEDLAAADPEVYRILHSALGHVKAAHKINELFEGVGVVAGDERATTSESSVRRYRERSNWKSPNPEPGEAPDRDYDGLEERYDDLQRQHNRTLVSLSKAHAKRSELVSAVFGAATPAG